MALHLEVVTPDGSVLSTEAEYVGIPGVAGQFGVMPGHIPLLSAVAIGGLYYRMDGVQKDVFVSGGFAEVLNDKVVILAEAAELQQDIDVERALQAKERAEKRLLQAKNGDAGIDVDRAHAALTRAIMRINISSGQYMVD